MKTTLHRFWGLGFLTFAILSLTGLSVQGQTDSDDALINSRDAALKELIPALERRSKSQPNNTSIWFQLGLAYGRANRPADAITSFQAATKLDPANLGAWKALGIASIGEKQYDQAVIAFKKAIDLEPYDPDIWNACALALLYKGDYTASNIMIERALKGAPHSLILWNTKGMLKEKLDDYPAAIDAFKQAITFDPKYVTAWVNRGIAEMHVKSYRDGIASLETASHLEPANYAAWGNLAACYAYDHRADQACDAAGHAVQLKPYDPSGWYILGNADFAAGKREEAVMAYHKAFDELDQSTLANDKKIYPGMLCEYAMATVIIGHVDDAELILSRAYELGPEDSRVLAGIGDVRMRQYRWEEARASLQKSIDLDPKVAHTWANLGLTMTALNHPLAESLEALQKAISLQPDDGNNWFLSGTVAEMLHKSADAAAAYRKAIEINPKMREAWRRLAITTPDPIESQKASAQAIALAPDDSGSYLLFAALQLARRNWTEAESEDRKAIDADKNSPAAWAQLADILVEESKYPEALDAEQHALLLGEKWPPAMRARLYGGLARIHIRIAADKGDAEWQAGLDAATQATTLDPKMSAYWYSLAVCQEALGHREEAKVSAAKCLELGGDPKLGGNKAPLTPAAFFASLHPNVAPPPPGAATPTPQQKEALNAAAKVLQLLKDHNYAEALPAAQKLTELNPNIAANWFLLAQVYFQQKDFDSALPHFLKAAALEPKNPANWQGLGGCYAGQQKWDDATDAYTRLIQIAPDGYEGWNGLVVCFANKRDPGGGVSKISELSDANPNCSMGLMALGVAQLNNNMPAMGMATLQHAAEIKADSALIWNTLGVAYGRAQDIRKALDCFNRAVQLQPGWDEALNNFGYTNFLLGKTDLAIGAYKQALQSNPRHAQALFNLTTAYASQNKLDLAKQTCEQLAKVDPTRAAQLAQNQYRAPALTPGP